MPKPTRPGSSVRVSEERICYVMLFYVMLRTELFMVS